MAKLQVTPAAAFTEYRELNFQGLYLHHIFLGPNPTQVQIAENKAPLGIGDTEVNNWPVYDGPDKKNANLIARAQGLHTFAGNWYNSFSLVFEDVSGFGGSTLQVTGIVIQTGDWAVVGGTGKFAMANGVISKVNSKWEENAGEIIELKIHAFCPKLDGTRYPVVTKSELFGGSGGSLFDIEKTPMRLESITICSGWVVDSIAFSYIDYTGQKHSVGPWGGSGGNKPQPTIQLGESEFVTQVSGTFGRFEDHAVITSIKFVTNLNKNYKYGDEARGNPSPFNIPVQPGNAIVGFFARAGKYLDAIGAHVRTL